MFNIIIFSVLLLTSTTLLVDGLICATDCSFSTQIGNITYPNCTVTDKPSTEQSCQVELKIDYVSGSIVGHLRAITPPSSFFYLTHTVLSFDNEISNLTIQLDCSTMDNCDQDFIEQALQGDWVKVQNEVKNLTDQFAIRLFNSSDLRPHETCPANQSCSGEGFCTASLSFLSGWGPFAFKSTCANSTEQPLLHWVRLVDESMTMELISYICNTPLCASNVSAALTGAVLEQNYILPFNVTTSTTTTTTESTTTVITTTTSSTSTITTTNKSRSIHLNHMEKITLVFVFVLLLCLSIN